MGGTAERKGHNLLDEFYKDKERFAYTFQNYIFLTRMMQVQHSHPSLPLLLYMKSAVHGQGHGVVLYAL